MKSWYVVSVAYARIEAASPKAAVEIVASRPRQGIGRDLVVKTAREAEALVEMVIPHVGVSASGAVSVTVGGRRGPKAKPKPARVRP